MRDGSPEYAVLPWDEYRALLNAVGAQPTTVMESSSSQVPKPALKQLSILREAQGLKPGGTGALGGHQPRLPWPDRSRRARAGCRDPPCAGTRAGYFRLGGRRLNQQSAAVSISRQHWQALLDELAEARRQRHLVTYRALLERLQLPTPAMQTLTAALEHWPRWMPVRSVRCVAPGHQPGCQPLAPHRFLRVCRSSGAFQRPCRRLAAASWHAGEVARVFEFDYPEVP